MPPVSVMTSRPEALSARLWSEKHYLADPHSAVAFHVLEEYRTQTGDETPAIVVSTASPFKFCADVLEALGEKEIATGIDVIDQLSEKTGVAAPKPLAALKHFKTRPVCGAAPEEMERTVLDFLN